MARGAVDRTKLDDVAERLGSRLVAAVPVGWGDARSTFRLSLADGRQFAVRAFVGPETRTRVDQIGRLMTDLARAGLPVPPPTIVETARGPWLATPWVEGETGASWLGDPDRARHLADRMGRLVARLRAVGPVAIGLSGHAPADEPAVDPLERVAFVHGDFAPVNVVMDEGGEIAALLDFEHARAGPALLDVAWWGWVVRHHHPVAWSASWPTFLRAAGLDSGPVEARLHDLVLGTLAERAADSDDPEVRRRWLDRLTEARRWKVQGG